MKWECKNEPHFTLDTLFLYKNGDPKLEPYSNLFFSIRSRYDKCFSVKDNFIFKVILGLKWKEIQAFLKVKFTKITKSFLWSFLIILITYLTLSSESS